MIESFQTVEERIMNNNVGLIGFIHSVILETAMLKRHSSNFSGDSFRTEECRNSRQVHTEVKPDGEQVC